jgi:acyl phosphate:glycerol-3-phosphate acyltransferase
MREVLLPLMMVVIGYLCGSFPSGVILSRIFKGIDLRDYGSGRTGGTNALRTLGLIPAAIVIVLDLLKGSFAIFMAKGAGLSPWIISLVGIAAILGHNHSIFLKFKGGAGVATAIGVMAALNFPVGLVVSFAGLAVIVLTRYASAGSLTITTLSALSFFLLGILEILPFGYSLFGFLQALIIILAHRPNIRRLIAGTERRLGEGGKKITNSISHS